MQGVHAYGSVLDIPEPVDLAVVTVPAARVAEVVQSCGAKGVHGLVVMTGFSDDQIDGPEARRTMVSAARAAGMRIVGPSCLGVVNTDPRVRMNASLAPVVPPPGRIGFFCQSGALGVAILADAAARGLGLSTFVSAGDRADVSGNDLLQFWHGDDRTEVVLLYLESFGNPRKFARLARVLGKTKPVIAVKSGRHVRTTVGLAGNRLDDAVVGTLFEQSGVIRTPGLTDAFDVAQLLSTQPVPAGNRVGIVGNSKALGVLAVDFCLDAGLQVTDDAPTDLGVTVSAEAFGTAVRQAMARPDVDALVVAWVPPVAIPGTAHAAALRDAVAGATKPVVTTFLAVDGLVDHLAVRDTGGHPGRGSVPAYGTLERAVSALSHAVRYGAWLSRPAGGVPELTGVDPAAARAAVDRMRNAGDPERALTDAELVTLLSCYGISLLPHRMIHAVGEAVEAAAEIGYPVTLKSSDPSIRRRIDQSGVRLGLMNADQVAAAYADLTQITGPALYVQAMAPRDHAEVSTIFGITSDPSFGALISFGIGGIATELLNDRAYRAVPLTDVDASRTDQCTACGATARWLPGHPACRNGAPGRPRIEVVHVGRRPAGGRGTAAPPGPVRARRDSGDQRDRAHRAAVRAARRTPPTELTRRSRLGPPPRSGLGYSRQHVLYEPPRAVHRSKGSTRTPAQANTATTETIGLSCGTPCLFVKRMGSPECPPDRCHWSWISSGSSRLP